jgi:hypothetical protein
MELAEGLKLKGNPIFIDAPRSALPKFFKEYGFKKGVEIGVSWGQNIVDYCEAGLEIYGVDPWQSTDEDNFRKIISIHGKYGSTPEGVYQLARERTDKYPNCHLLKMTSLEALKHFEDKSLDFVYIDGNHSFGYVAMDLMKWNRKVRKGGAIAGHDYGFRNPGKRRKYRAVGNIVDAFAKNYDFTNWHVLTGDEDYSFLFFKHW